MEFITDRLSPSGGEDVVHLLGDGEAGSGPAPMGERQAWSASGGNRGQVTDPLMDMQVEEPEPGLQASDDKPGPRWMG